ncbi:MAG: type II toxin-antitoxin system RelE/ParE family toxin [Pseudomonadota bacterium]
MADVVEYLDEQGVSPFADWFNDLDAQAAAKVATAIARMGDGNFGDHKSVGEGVVERRLTHGPGYRIYFGRDGDTLVILLVGGTKKRQDNDIAKAKELWADYKARKEGG